MMKATKNERARGRAVLPLMLSSVVMLALCAVPRQSQAPAPQSTRYPNELPALRVHERARWKGLTPLVSTAADVRRAMGEPARAYDTARLGTAYPGDAKAVQPVFVYEDADATTHIYFGRYCLYTAELAGKAGDRLCQVVLAPKRGIRVDASAFTTAFRRETKRLPNESWDEYADDDGLVYVVKHDGGARHGAAASSVSRVMYGPRRAELGAQPTDGAASRASASPPIDDGSSSSERRVSACKPHLKLVGSGGVRRTCAMRNRRDR